MEATAETPYCIFVLAHQRSLTLCFSCTQKEHGLVKNNIYCMPEVLRGKELD